MKLNNDISSQNGSKGNVVHAHQVASTTAGTALDIPQRHMAADAMTVDQLMQAAFFNGRTLRSAEYKAGTRMSLEHRIDRTDIALPYQAGTAAAVAFFAGVDEGKSVLRATIAKIGGAG